MQFKLRESTGDLIRIEIRLHGVNEFVTNDVKVGSYRPNTNNPIHRRCSQSDKKHLRFSFLILDNRLNNRIDRGQQCLASPVEICGIDNSYWNFDTAMLVERRVLNGLSGDGAIGHDQTAVVWCIDSSCKEIDLMHFGSNAVHDDRITDFEWTKDHQQNA